MSEPTKVNLFTAQSGSAVSAPYVLAIDEEDRGEEHVVSIHVRQSNGAAWNAADVTVEECHDLDASPQPWQTVQNSSLANVTAEADANIPYLAQPGLAFRVRIVDTGSPLTPLTVTAYGPIASAT